MFHDPLANRVISIVAKKLILRKSGTYQKQFHRNYDVVAPWGKLNALAETIGSSGVTQVTPALLAKAGGQMMSLSAGIASPNAIAIPHDWNSSRGIFILELEVQFSTGGMIRYFVQGYTDHDGFSQMGNVDPQMRMYINNVITTTPVHVQTPMGTRTSLRVSGNYQTPTDFGAAQGYSPTPLMVTRPQDVFGRIKNDDLSSSSIMVSDTSSVVGNNLTSSRRRNNIPTSYLATVFNGYSDGMMENRAADFTSGDAAEQAFGLVVELDAVNDIFLTKLRETNNLTRGRNHFTYRELLQVAPNVDMVKDVRPSSMAMTQLSQAGDSNHFQGQTISTVAAVQLSQSIPALMLESMLSTVRIRISNMVSGQLDMAPMDEHAISCFSPDDVVRQYMLFKTRVLNEVIGPLTENNQLNFHAEISCSFHSEFIITIKIGSDPETRFVTPAFADSLTAPVVTNNSQKLGELSSTLATMCTHVADAISDSHMRRDRIISSNLMAPSTGALNRDAGSKQAFAIPTGVNGAYVAPAAVPVAPSANTMGNFGGSVPQTRRGPSATSM